MCRLRCSLDENLSDVLSRDENHFPINAFTFPVVELLRDVEQRRDVVLPRTRSEQAVKREKGGRRRLVVART